MMEFLQTIDWVNFLAGLSVIMPALGVPASIGHHFFIAAKTIKEMRELLDKAPISNKQIESIAEKHRLKHAQKQMQKLNASQKEAWNPSTSFKNTGRRFLTHGNLNSLTRTSCPLGMGYRVLVDQTTRPHQRNGIFQSLREKIYSQIAMLNEFKAVTQNEFKNINSSLEEIKQQQSEIIKKLDEKK